VAVKFLAPIFFYRELTCIEKDGEEAVKGKTPVEEFE